MHPTPVKKNEEEDDWNMLEGGESEDDLHMKNQTSKQNESGRPMQDQK